MIDFKKVVKATVDVVLADGCSDIIHQIHIKIFEDQLSYEYPEFGNCKTENQIKRLVYDKVEHTYSLKAFPYRKIGLIDLYVRDENNHKYLKFLTSLKGEL